MVTSAFLGLVVSHPASWAQFFLRPPPSLMTQEQGLVYAVLNIGRARAASAAARRPGSATQPGCRSTTKTAAAPTCCLSDTRAYAPS
jgi:hypothetical protein